MLELPNEEVNGKIEPKINKKHLTLENISFGYGKEKMIIKNVHLTVKEGEKIAIIGENGSGKTTLINLILGIDISDSGEIYLGNCSLKEIGLKKWRENFAVVRQKPYLFKGSIKDNIDLYNDRTIQEIKKVSNIYGLNMEFYKNNEWLEYQISDDGRNLSGGERQKIAFLRAMIKDASIIILDEAFSNCDKESRNEIRKMIFDTKFSKTVILVSHYQEDIKDISKTYKLDNGILRRIS